MRVLVDADLAAGHQSVTWDGRDTAGRALPSGDYVARFEASDVRQSRKLMLDGCGGAPGSLASAAPLGF